ncbi:putative monovalent cation/H+ antiporter subunit A [Pseudodesulfovibrio mercurii]|uniref:Putative monovalent cation/H+ antiporter subunit A n=1 Tax=Pseudodesulfovibrio mercurii TaxID=641491 RepID=F0JGY3_9BACT|nr:hypothetical protein [Pseudodesulfovibrio mercurii]EGB15173.1 putative monovalent cation/H+ antiporter subunit A [Pseudodesulfovibrio mercurii]
MTALLRFLFTRGHALAGFLLLKAVAVVVNGLAQGTAEVWGLGILTLVVYGIIARFAQAGRVISIWAITVLMLYEAAGGLLLAWSSLTQAPGVAAIGFAVAAYLVVGALAVLSSRREA